MKPLLSLALTLAALAAPRAHAGPILDPSSSLSSYYVGSVANTSGTVSATPSPTGFNSFQFTASASGRNYTSITESTSGTLVAFTDYNGTFKLDGAYNYQLAISGTQSISSTATNGAGAAYSEGILSGPGVSVGYSGLVNSENYLTTTGPLSLSGTLGPGDYAITAIAEVENYLNAGSIGDINDSATLSYSLQLSPAATPEPASLTLLGLGGLGLAGYGWRRRKLSSSP